ncbi:30S ribosomal protein S12 methylthiotransferase RimO [candidate division KSB1 bacterium]
MNETVQIITLGCPKNEVDSEIIGGIIERSGYSIYKGEDEEHPDIVLINTCGFIQDAKTETLEQIEQVVALKEKGYISKIYVAGCLVKRYEDDLKNSFKGIDGFFSVTDFLNIANEFSGSWYEKDLIRRVLFTPGHYAYLKIAEGCDYKCSFCVIPGIRGPMKSRPVEQLLNETHRLVENGVREIIVIAEDITQYGRDLDSKNDLITLLEKMETISGLHWIRLLYAFPGNVSDRLVEIIRSSNKICKYLDIPIQHAADSVLKNMNRTYRQKHVVKLIDSLRKEIPGITLRSSVIVGYPGETEKDFIALSDFLTDIAFERLGVFSYSDEPGAEAFNAINKVEPEIITERYEEIRLNQDVIAEKKSRERIGTTIEVIVDEKDGETGDYLGRTEGDAPEIDNIVRITRAAVPGEFLSITVNNATAFELTGN